MGLERTRLNIMHHVNLILQNCSQIGFDNKYSDNDSNDDERHNKEIEICQRGNIETEIERRGGNILIKKF